MVRALRPTRRWEPPTTPMDCPLVLTGRGIGRFAPERMIVMAKDTIKYEGPTGVLEKEGYSYSSTYTCTDAEKGLVEVIHKTQCKDKLKVYVRNVMDFGGMDQEEILEFASKAAIIASRGPEFRSRTAKKVLEELEGKTLVAKDYFKRERKSKTFEEKVQELVDSGIDREDAELMLKDPVAFYHKMQAAMKALSK